MLTWIVFVEHLQAALLQSISAPRKVALGFLSFDLDDTLFPASEVMRDSNARMIQKMQEVGFQTTLNDYIDTARKVRQGLSAPVRYSDLRRLAIKEEMLRLSRDKSVDVNLVETIFDCWLEERHKAAERHLFQDSIPMLKEIRRAHPSVCIGAITNGNGNPLEMKDTLKLFFDFSVSGEHADLVLERKPHPRIYINALERYRFARPSHHANNNDMTYVWCHVGDCLANDVGASASCGALPIWLFRNNSQSAMNNPSWSTASHNEWNHRASLAHEAKRMVTAQISCLAELPRTIDQILTLDCVQSLR